MTNPKTRKILIADDHRLFADGLSLILTQFDSKLNVTTVYNARTLLDDAGALRKYDLLIVDINMPNLNGLDFIRALKNRCEDFKVLIISGSEDINDVEQALRLGACGFAPKSLPPLEILAAIDKVLSNEIFLPRALAQSVDWLACQPGKANKQTRANTSPDLRPRQLEVLKLMNEGHKNAQIGTILGISESAVKYHISSVFKALNTQNRTAAIRVATQLGLLG